MRFNPRTWFLLSIMLFIAAAFFWQKGDELQERRGINRDPNPSATPASPGGETASQAINLLSAKGNQGALAHLSQNPVLQSSAGPSAEAKAEAELAAQKRHPYRLRNSQTPLETLAQSDSGLLLANALIDTKVAAGLKIPDHLKADSDPASYIVQWNGPVNHAFRELLANAKAEIVSYVPNNAFLVKASAEQATALKAAAGVQSVVAYEPYFKFDTRLLALAVKNESLPENALLRLTLFPNEAAAGIENVERLNAQVLAQEPSPFGPQLVIRPNLDSLAALARLPMVQAIEPDIIRTPANDNTRVLVGVSENSVTNVNYLGLTGTNVWVNMNDLAVDTNHPALDKRVFPAVPNMGMDTNGHGTFVAGVLIGDGAGSASINYTNVSGSMSNANYRGIAPGARLFVLPINGLPAVYPKVQDTYLIETAAATNYLTLGRTNAMISNNSWVYSGASEYDSSAARYDAAVRDAMLGRTGEQPLLFVFAAGNGGFGANNGQEGEPGSIFSPGTAKNVITVGALESARFITNSYTNIVVELDSDGNATTNKITNNIAPFLTMTDSSTEVAGYSSRGNVGAGLEGTFGRFKPDVVAPGSFIVSLRSQDWRTNSYATNDPAGQLLNTNLNANLGDYRFDSGTTFAAPVVSGMAALIEEFFRTKASNVLQRPASPALMKAMIINSARSAHEQYSLQINSLINYQGWGLPNLQRAIPTNLTQSAQKRWTTRLIDQSSTNALATGESRTWNVTLTTNSMSYPLRITLVWTDPPGNPQTGIKLVNDLDLVVTNKETSFTVYGNDIPTRSDFSAIRNPALPRFVAPRDFVNNVESIIIPNPRSLGTNFSITVQARRVNVNSVHDFFSVTGKTNDVVQDFALVISSDIDQPGVDVFDTFTEPAQSAPKPREGLTIITNGLPLINERIGANASLAGTNGITNQWRFYVFTNTYIPNSLLSITNGTNIAFVTFVPPNLSRARNLEADIDLYVSTDARLTNLHPAAIEGALKSTERGGTEMVAMTNAVLDEIYYVGVKSEDQNGGEYSLIGVSSRLPFEQQINGKTVLMGMPFNVFLPDGSPNQPSANTTIAIGLSPKRVLRAVVTNIITHENIGDLIGVLRHNGFTATLNNHVFPTNNSVTNSFVYDDNLLLPRAPVLAPQKLRFSDGPGTLNNFTGTKIVGPWILQMIDNAPSHTGRVDLVSIAIDPLQDNLLPGVTIRGEVGATPLVYPIDVPAGVTNMIILLNPTAGNSLLEVALRRDEIPTQTDRDFAITNTSPGASIFFDYGTGDTPPLQAGTYYLSVRNLTPNLGTVKFDLLMLFEYGKEPDSFADVIGGGRPVTDDAITNSTVFVRSDKTITEASVSLHLTHERMSDLAVALISPQGTRVLLTENRGQGNDSGFGRFYTVTNGAVITTNTAYALFTDNIDLAELPIKFAIPPYADLSTNVGQIYTNGFEGATNGTYVLGANFDGWTVTSNRVAVIQRPDAPEGDVYLVVTGGGVRHTLPTIKGRSYKLFFSFRAGEELNLFGTGISKTSLPLSPLALDPNYSTIASPDIDFPGPDLFVAPPNLFQPATPAIPNGQWITLNPATSGTTGNTNGTYIYRTYFSMFGKSLVNASITGRWASDNFSTNVLLNGAPTTNSSFNFAPNNFNITSSFVPGINTLDFVVENRGSVTGLKAELTLNALANPAGDMSGLPYATMSLQDNGANAVVGSAQWQLAEFEFVAEQDDTEIVINSGYPGIWIDNISLIDTGTKYYLPEEPLDILNGERALGEWTLEIWDTRLGATVNDALLEWQLNLEYAGPSFYAEPLRFGVTFPNTTVRTNQPAGITPGTIRRAEEQYFLVETCPDTTTVTVTLTGLNNVGLVELLASYDGFPVGDAEKDTFPILGNNQTSVGNNGVVTFTLTTNSPSSAPLRPGLPLFLSVRNRFITQTNSFQLSLAGNGSCAQDSIIRTLNSNNTVQSSLAPAEEENSTQVYSYTVTASVESVAIVVESPGDVGVVVSKDTVPEENGNFDYKSDSSGGTEAVVITPNSAPTPLTAGQWFITVYNNTHSNLNYSITATPTAAGQGGPTAIVNGGSLSTMVSPSNSQTTAYRFDVPDDATAVLFELFGLGGNADLWVQRGAVPTLTGNFRISANGGTTSEQIVLRDGIDLTDISGDWYLVIKNNEQNAIPATLRAIVSNDGVLPAGQTLRVTTLVEGGNVLLTWNSVPGERYQVQTSADLAEWTPVRSLTASGSSTTYQAENWGENARFFRVVQIPR